MINRRFAFILALLFSLSGLAASNYEKGLKAFLENDRDDAIDHLEESIQDGKMVPESHLLLCLTYSIIENTPATFMHFKAFIASAKDPYPYVAALWGSSETGLGAYKKDNERLEFLEELINTPALPGKLRAMCFDALCRHYKAVGDFEKAREQSLQIGAIQNWSSVGPFENISASGFKKNFGAVEHPEPTYSFKSKYGASVKWFETKGPQIEQWMKNYYSFHAFNALVYSQTFIQSPKKQKVQIRLGVGGSVKLWLNDHLIYSETDERDNDIDSHVIEVELAKGKNRILIQVGEADNDKSEFFVRITDEDGLPVNGITSDAFGTKYSTDKPEFKVLRNYEEAYFEDLVKEDPSLMNRIMLAKSYARNDNRYLARKTLNKAIMEAPNSSYLQLSLAFVYMSEGNRTGIATIISWLKRNDLKNPVSLSLTFNEALGNENYQTADSILDIYVSEYGATASYYEDAIELAIDQEDNSQLFYLIESAYDLYSDNATFVRYKSLILGSKNTKAKKAIKCVKKFLKKNYDYDMYTLLAKHYFDAKNGVAGIEVYKQLAQMFPYFAPPRETVAEIYYFVGAYSLALDYIEEAIEISPYTDEYWGLKGKILEEMDEYVDAEDAYNRCIELYPSSYEIREKLRLLTEEKSLYDLFKSEDYYKLYENSPGKEEYPDDNSLILRYHEQNIVYNGGGSERRIIQMVKVFNSAGIDDWKEYWLPIYGYEGEVVEKLEVLKKDGSKLEAEREGPEVVFTNLEPGDAILMIYKVKHYYFGKLAFNFWDQHYFTRSYPCLENSYSLMIHKDVDFQYKFSNGGFEPEVASHGEYKQYTWTRDSITSVQTEDYMSRYVDFGEVLFISTFPDWTYISNWYSDLAAAKSTPNFEVKETVAELFKDKENLTDREKVEIIYTYIVKNIRYSSVDFRQSGLIPQKATSVLNTKVGDCKDVSTLFVAMCKEAGIKDAGLVLVNTRDNGAKDLMLPSISFNHCIGRVTLDGQTCYVELTSEHLSFLSYGESLLNAFVLEIYDESQDTAVEGFYFNPNNRNKNEISRTTTVSIEGRNMVVSLESKKTGFTGTSMKYAYKDLPEKERRESLLKILNEDHKNVTLKTLEFDDFDTLNDEFNYSYSFVIENHISKTAGLNIFQIPWADAITSTEIVSDEDRSYPIELWRFMRYDRAIQEMTIELPAGARLAERPKNVTLDTKFGTYKLSFRYVGNKIMATRELIPKVQVVEPEDFEAFKKFVAQIVEYDAQNIAYR